jgi:hypothetical protein
MDDALRTQMHHDYPDTPKFTAHTTSESKAEATIEYLESVIVGLYRRLRRHDLQITNARGDTTSVCSYCSKSGHSWRNCPADIPLDLRDVLLSSDSPLDLKTVVSNMVMAHQQIEEDHKRCSRIVLRRNADKEATLPSERPSLVRRWLSLLFRLPAGVTLDDWLGFDEEIRSALEDQLNLVAHVHVFFDGMCSCGGFQDTLQSKTP